MDPETSVSLQLPQQCHQFTIAEIHLATQNFDESLVIGRGGFGMVYKGTITKGTSPLVAAIKRLDPTSNQGAVEFWNEVEMLSKLRHRHLVSLIGYCNDGQEMILVYEYMPHKTLEDHLHKLKTPLTWVLRLKICIGVARGLDYLHARTGVKDGIIHRDIKSSNILLDERWAAKISDFGLSKLGPMLQVPTQVSNVYTFVKGTHVSYVSTSVKGTFGYLDPHYFSTGHLTRKSDVYAFGVVLLEVLSGKRAVDSSLDDEHWGLVNWAQVSMKGGRLKQIVDRDIRERILPKCLKEFARLADLCLHGNPKKRPTMTEVVACLECVLGLQEKAMGITSGRRGSKSLNLYFDTAGGDIRILRGFEFETINAATENFSEGNKIERCSFGPSMYKYQDYRNEVSLLVKLEHENLLQLLGYSIKGRQVFLVYEFAACTSLDGLIYDRKCILLDWNKRKAIILAVARVLLYLHQHRVIHGNVTPGNILLDESLAPKLSDFGCARCLAINEADSVEANALRGSSGYTAPEIRQANRLSTKADVYSFGVLILETITGCSMYQCIQQEIIWTDWLEGTSSNIKDPKIDADSSSVTRFIHIGLLCVQEFAADRPTMEEVVGMLTNTSSLTPQIPDEFLSSWIKEKSSDVQEVLMSDDILSLDEISLSDDYDFKAVEDFVSELHPR